MPVPKGTRIGGRKKGTKNKPRAIPLKVRKALGRQAHETLAQLDRKKGEQSMAEILIEGARYIAGLAREARAERQEAIKAKAAGDEILAEQRSVELTQAAAKLAKDAAPYLYPTLQSIKHSGDEDAPPIRIESMSDYQLEQLLKRLSRT